MSTPRKHKGYRAVCITLFDHHLDDIDEKIAELKGKGWRSMSRSQLLRIALERLDISTIGSPS
jgi:hypothetical protein